MGRGRFVRFIAVAVGSLMVAAMAPVTPAAQAVTPPFALDRGSVFAPAPADFERFGDAVVLQGDTMVVSAPDHAGGGSLEAGIVYVYERVSGTWQYRSTLQPAIQSANDHFGASVAISGDRIVVGAPGYEVGGVDSGAAFVFSRTDTGWTSAGQLAAGGAITGDLIGSAVDIDGGTIVVGCPGAESGRGEVRPYTWNGTSWAEDASLSDPEGAAGDHLGECVSLCGVTVLASATGDDVEALVDAGSVVSFTIGASIWSYEARITAPTPTAGEGFGRAIDLGSAGNRAVVGSPSHDAGADTDAGRAYVYERGAAGWGLASELPNPAVTTFPAGDRFGSAVAYDGGDLIVVGAVGADTGDDDNDGAAYYFQLRSGVWMKVQDVTPPDSPCCREFGAAVALNDGTAAIGAPLASAG